MSKRTELVFIIDRSGSMCGLESDTIGGFNATINKHKGLEGECIVSTVLFDDQRVVLHDRVSIADIKPMTEKDYQVRGCTALLDAMGCSMKHIGRVQGYMPDEYKADQVIFVIITDGMENASREFSAHQIKKAVETRKEQGWEFIFLGANIDAVEEAGRLGISEDRSVTYLADSVGQGMAYDAIAAATCCMREAAAPISGNWKASVEADTKKRGKKSKRFF